MLNVPVKQANDHKIVLTANEIYRTQNQNYVSLGSDICLVINDDRHDDDDDDDDDGNDDDGFLMAEPNGLIPTTVELNYLDIRC